MTTWAATIEISIDAQPHRNIHTNPIRYKFNQTDKEVFESTLEATLSSGDVLELKSQARSHNEANEAVASPKISKKNLPQMKNS